MTIHPWSFLFVRSQSNDRHLPNGTVGIFSFDQHLQLFGCSAGQCILTAEVMVHGHSPSGGVDPMIYSSGMGLLVSFVRSVLAGIRKYATAAHSSEQYLCPVQCMFRNVCPECGVFTFGAYTQNCTAYFSLSLILTEPFHLSSNGPMLMLHLHTSFFQVPVFSHLDWLGQDDVNPTHAREFGHCGTWVQCGNIY